MKRKYYLLILIMLVITSCKNNKEEELMNDKEYYLPSNLEITIDAEGTITKIKEIENGCVIIANGKRYEYNDSYVMPSLCDAHGHFTGLGRMLVQPDFRPAKSEFDCIQIAKEFKPNRGKWIYGRGWNHESWEKKELPTKKSLDSAFPDIPVCFRRVDGHSSWVNSIALQMAGINKNTPDPQGGKIVKDANGEPTGVLIDNAGELVENLIPDYSAPETQAMIVGATKELISKGVTEIGAIDVLASELPYYMPYYEKNEPTLRLQVYLSAHSDEYLADSTYWHFKNDYINIRGIKFYADGALGSYGAGLLEPYSDMPDNSGLLFWTEDALYKKAKAGMERGFDIATHAIGDSANRLVINVYERLNAEYAGKTNRPLLRLEHAQLLNESDPKRLVKNNIIASMQPTHCTSDAQMCEKRIGLERSEKTGYKWKTLMDLGTKLIAGSDFPIESHNPFTGIDAFVNRIPTGDSIAWFPSEKISLDEAVKSYTIYPRKYLGINDRGSIKVGNKADIIIIDNDLKEFSNISNTKVLSTFINGVLLYQSEDN